VTPMSGKAPAHAATAQDRDLPAHEPARPHDRPISSSNGGHDAPAASPHRNQATSSPGDDEAARHQRKMAARKAVQDAEVASKTVEKGLLLVNTGAGKGKSTAAFGLLLRMVGHGRPCGVVQFIKGAWSTGERTVLEGFGPLVEWHSMGEGFTWETQDRARDVAAATAAWERALAMMARPGLALIVLDELCIALRYNYLDTDAVVAALRERRAGLHVVVTGRNAPAALTEAADLVTEMQPVKHHFAAGVRAQQGIEF